MDTPNLQLSGLRVLIVEDNLHMRSILRAMVAGFGFAQVYEADDGADALECIASHDPDLVIVDWLMPIINGAELTRRIRTSSEPGCFVPIIAVTAHSEKRRIIEARDKGVTEIMCKPVSPKGLYLRVVNCILHPRDFIRTKTFFGPDRRRFQNPDFNGEERRGIKVDDGYALDDQNDLPQSHADDTPRESVA